MANTDYNEVHSTDALSERQVENELKKYGIVLWHWAWLIVLGTLLGGSIAYISSRLTMPVYAASTTLLVNEAPSSGKTADYTSILTSERLARTYSEMMTKQPVLEEALKDLNLENIIQASDLPARIDVSLLRDTQLMVFGWRAKIHNWRRTWPRPFRRRSAGEMSQCRRALFRFEGEPE